MEEKNLAKESLIREILSLLPRILEAENLKELTYEELRDIVDANRHLNYYANLIRKQKISVIKYVYDERYSLVQLYSLSEAEIDVLYLNAIKKNRSEFEQQLESILEVFKEEALANGHEEYLAFSEEELIIASGALVPQNLLTEEEYVSKSTLLRIHEINKKIEELNKENSEMQETIASSRNYMLILDLRGDINYNNDCIKRLQEELRQLISPGSDNLSLTRHKNESEE